jgi:hypothetical protein
MQSYAAVKQAYQVHFPDAAVPNKSAIFDFLIDGITLSRVPRNIRVIYSRVGDTQFMS